MAWHDMAWHAKHCLSSHKHSCLPGHATVSLITPEKEMRSIMALSSVRDSPTASSVKLLQAAGQEHKQSHRQSHVVTDEGTVRGTSERSKQEVYGNRTRHMYKQEVCLCMCRSADLRQSCHGVDPEVHVRHALEAHEQQVPDAACCLLAVDFSRISSTPHHAVLST